VVPEAAVARIEGTLAAGGQLQLPQRSGSIKFHAEAIEVGGLGTEALQFGSFAMACRDAGGAPRRTLTGDSEPRWITLDRMGLLPAAVIAAEDQRFELHAGYDDTEIASLLASVEPEGLRRGASTLTQQLARTLFTGGEKTVARKLRELLYAIEMERTLGKPRILELYLNAVDWGPGLCGARDAARTYFRKRPEQLTPLEAAWLAGILRAPHAAHAQQFVGGTVDAERARWVLMQMRGMARSERERWRRKPLVLASPRPGAAAGLAPRQADRNTPVAEGAVEVAEAPRHRRGAVRTAAVVR
jgi:membrane peptidoglycan carboxypeptidase